MVIVGTRIKAVPLTMTRTRCPHQTLIRKHLCCFVQFSTLLSEWNIFIHSRHSHPSRPLCLRVAVINLGSVITTNAFGAKFLEQLAWMLTLKCSVKKVASRGTFNVDSPSFTPSTLPTSTSNSSIPSHTASAPAFTPRGINSGTY